MSDHEQFLKDVEADIAKLTAALEEDEDEEDGEHFGQVERKHLQNRSNVKLMWFVIHHLDVSLLLLLNPGSPFQGIDSYCPPPQAADSPAKPSMTSLEGRLEDTTVAEEEVVAAEEEDMPEIDLLIRYAAQIFLLIFIINGMNGK